MARALRLADANPQGVLFAGADAWVRELALTVKNCGVPVVLVDTNFRNVSEARMAGLTAECASILSEHVQEEIDLSGIGRLMALTPNDEVNALAIRELRTCLAERMCISWRPATWILAAASRCRHACEAAWHLTGR